MLLKKTKTSSQYFGKNLKNQKREIKKKKKFKRNDIEKPFYFFIFIMCVSVIKRKGNVVVKVDSTWKESPQ